ncbi:MAG: adenylate/guanylate cyclase domain-containing protein [Rhizobiales bacterium]|nr:adenylate/guanylate cyclase domain-containing protein [Hyphomicrobiales bacterium]
MPAETKYARSGDVSIAYQVTGKGPVDLVIVPGFVSHLEQGWENRNYAAFLDRLGSFARLIRFDKRGTGLSDRVSDVPTLEQRMDDVRAVMDAAGSERAALMGISEGGPMSVLFAATYPQRTSALVLYGSIARGAWDPEYPWGTKKGPEWEDWLRRQQEEWGGPFGVEFWAPSVADDESFRQWWAKYLRLGASPTAVTSLWRMNAAIDVRPILPAVRVPTLVLHRTGDMAVNIEEGRLLARHIPGAKLVELPGRDHLWWVGDWETIASEVEEFITGERRTAEPDRVLLTVLFTDIVDSTRRAAMLGDQRWKELLDSHNVMMRSQIDRFRGRAIKNLGDGFLAVFDGPARAINCALSASREIQKFGLDIRSALHTGEVELIGEDIGGIAVHTAARVLGKCAPCEVWTSRTVRDLVAGSKFKFTDQGLHELRGIEGEWPLFSVVEQGAPS